MIRNKTALINHFISKRQNALRVMLYLTYFWCYIVHSFSFINHVMLHRASLEVANSFRLCFSRLCLINRLPRIHIMIDIIIEKVIFLRIQDIVTEYGSSRFSANFSEIRESNMLASFPIPPLTEKTNGVKVPFSICKIRSLYFVSSPFHLTCNIAVGFCYHTTWRLRQESLRKKILYGI